MSRAQPNLVFFAFLSEKIKKSHWWIESEKRSMLLDICLRREEMFLQALFNIVRLSGIIPF